MKFEINVERREKAGKGPARELRRNGRIPAVLYGSGESLCCRWIPRMPGMSFSLKPGILDC